MTAIQTVTPVDRLADSLRRLVRGRSELDVAQFQFIGLDKVRIAYGDLWPKRRDRLFQIVEDYLLTRLDAGDILVRGIEGFLIVFGDRMGARADQAAKALASGINTYFVGIGERPAPELTVETRPIPAAQIARKLRDHGAAAEPLKVPAPALPTAAEVDWLFQPVWDARRELISSYFLLPHLKGSQRRVPGYQFETASGHTPNFADLDVASLDISEKSLRDLAQQGKRALIGVTIHIQSLMNGEISGRIMNRLISFDRSLARYRLIKIAGVGPGFPRLHLGHIVGSLKARVPLVVLTASWDEPNMASLVRTGPTAVGFAYPDGVAGALSAMAEGTLMSRFRAGADAAHSHGMALYAEGQIGLHLARELSAAGADYLSSPLIWRPQAEADGIRKWQATRLTT